MPRRILAGSALLVLTFAGCSDDDRAGAHDVVEIPLSFQGAWTGPITAGLPTVSPFIVDLDLAATGGAIAIERSECRGTLAPTAFDGSVLTLTGTWPTGSCLDGGTWRLTVTGTRRAPRRLDLRRRRPHRRMPPPPPLMPPTPRGESSVTFRSAPAWRIVSDASVGAPAESSVTFQMAPRAASGHRQNRTVAFRR